MSKRFHYTHDGVQYGPVEARELKAAAERGGLIPTDLVWQEGAPDWVAASTVKGLFPPAAYAAPVVPTRGGPPPLPPGGGQPSPSQRSAEFGQHALLEAKATAQATTEQLTRLVGFGSSRLKEQRLRREAGAALAVLGERLNQQGLGDSSIREQIARLHDEIEGAKLAKSSTRQQETQRRRLCAQLAEPFLLQPAPSGLETEHAAAMAAREAERATHDEVEQSQHALLPDNQSSRRRVLIGAAVLVVFLFVSGSVFLAVAGRVLGIGGGAHPSILLGEWKGTSDLIFGLKFTTEFDFHRNGRVFWYQDFGDLGDNRGAGTWKVTRVEGDRYTIEMHNDLDPDEAWGWVIEFDGNDEFTITGYDDMPITVQRVD